MTSNEITLTKFYTAFSKGNPVEMCECYHPKIKFRDPAFGLLKGDDVCKMWNMLLKKNKNSIEIVFSEIIADENTGSAHWIATYTFSQTNRKVVNNIRSQFLFEDGLIIKHTDDFDIWKWAKQALGWKGRLFGWTGFMQNKIQQKALKSLHKYS